MTAVVLSNGRVMCITGLCRYTQETDVSIWDSGSSSFIAQNSNEQHLLGKALAGLTGRCVVKRDRIGTPKSEDIDYTDVSPHFHCRVCYNIFVADNKIT